MILMEVIMLFKNYEYFLAIVESGSLSRAADKLYLSQPSLSKYLKRMENTLGVELFDHHSSPLKLTYTGERYLQYVQKVLALDNQLEKEFSELKDGARGKVSIGLAFWRSSCMLPEILPVFSTKYPYIEVNVMEGKSSFLEHELDHDRLDFAIMNLSPTADYSKLNYDIIMQERILLAGNSNHPLIKNYQPNSYDGPFPHFHITDLINEQFYLTKQGQNLTTMILQYFSKKNFHPQKIMETENLTTAINMVSANMGFTFVPEAGSKPNLLPPNISLFTVDKPSLSWPLAVFYKKDTYITQAARLYIEMMKEHYANLNNNIST